MVIARQIKKMFREGEAMEYEDSKGCYVFAVRHGRGSTPWYVGKTSRSGFGAECSTPHKVQKYTEALAEEGSGTPNLYLVVHPTKRGSVSAIAIDQLETFLIQHAFARNNRLLNGTKTQPRWWGVRGLDSIGRKGRVPRAAAELREMLRLD